MQSIPVDIARLGTCMCVVPPEPKTNQETGEVRTDRDGATVYVVGVAVRQPGRRGASVIEVSVSGQPKGVAEGTRVHLNGLEAFAWSMGDRSGISFRAASITPVSPPAAAAAAGKGGEDR
jgi:hypothetical protein